MSLPTVDDAYNAARDEPPFSNADEGYPWLDRWCGRCIHDRPAREGREGDGCPLVLVSLVGRTPAEWLRQPADSPDRYHCVMFRDERDPGPDEPRPVPDPPGQAVLFDREPYTRPCRMFADTRPTEVTA
jgi:hypothetical protein